MELLFEIDFISFQIYPVLFVFIVRLQRIKLKSRPLAKMTKGLTLRPSLKNSEVISQRLFKIRNQGEFELILELLGIQSSAKLYFLGCWLQIFFMLKMNLGVE